MLTDNAKAYADSAVFAETAARLGIHRKKTRPYRPQTNGKVERFNKTLLAEWAYARLYRSNNERRQALSRWLRSYNHRRPHTALDGLTPMAVLVNNAGGKHSYRGLPKTHCETGLGDHGVCRQRIPGRRELTQNLIGHRDVRLGVELSSNAVKDLLVRLAPAIARRSRVDRWQAGVGNPGRPE